MNHLKPAAAVAIAGWLMAASSAAFAGDVPPAGASGDGRIIEIYTDADANAVLNARIAALKTVLELTAAQETLWQPVENSIRKITADSMARGKQRAEGAPPADFLDILQRIGAAESARGQDLQSFAAAARPLVASLSEVQRSRMPAFLGMVSEPGAPLATRSLWLFEEEER